ncbi:hypothetical protein F0U59_49330 [Archangium gephyra]|nr:hypothetical protein F0U59_49330 [Archangium gephyra]
MRNRRSVVVLLVLLLAVTGIVLTVQKLHGAPGQPAPERTAARETVIEYLHALEARDRDGVLRLVPGDYEAAKDVDERLQRFGGAQAAAAHIDITSDLSPEVLTVNIRTVGPGGREMAWTENLFWRDGTWRLLLGGVRSPTRPAADLHRPAP